MIDSDDARLSDDELHAEFAALFPRGWAGPDVQAELAPAGWERSPLAAVFHPSADRLYEEAVQSHRSLEALGKPDGPPPPPAPTRADIAASHDPAPADPVRECRELVGLCLWDVFGDNHTVTAADGRELSLGSMRSAGGFLAEVLNRQGGPPPAAKPDLGAMFEQFMPPPAGGSPEVLAFYAQMRHEMVGDGGYTYLDFYMGTAMMSGRADLSPVYELIFRRLRARGLDWRYHFPRLYLVNLDPLRKKLDEEARGGEPEWAGYDPGAAFEAEQAEQAKEEERAAMRERLDNGHREAVAAARDAEPPATVRAYRRVYGEFPSGWPPEAEG